MGERHKYDFYYKIDEKSDNEGGKYLKYTYDRELPLDDKEYNIAATKLIDSVANDLDISKKYVININKEEFITKSNNNV